MWVHGRYLGASFFLSSTAIDICLSPVCGVYDADGLEFDSCIEDFIYYPYILIHTLGKKGRRRHAAPPPPSSKIQGMHRNSSAIPK